MWFLAGAAEVPASDNTQIILGIFTLLGIVATGIGGVVIALINARNRPPAATPAEPDPGSLRERVGVLEFRAEDNDQRDDVQDRHLDRQDDRLDAVERTADAVARFLDRRFPEWRS